MSEWPLNFLDEPRRERSDPLCAGASEAKRGCAVVQLNLSAKHIGTALKFFR